jgi:hypothetical protein
LSVVPYLRIYLAIDSTVLNIPIIVANHFASRLLIKLLTVVFDLSVSIVREML